MSTGEAQTHRVDISPRAPWKLMAWSLLVAYSVAHFLYSGVYFAWHSPGGDLLPAFTGSPLLLRMTQMWPALPAKDWIEPTTGAICRCPAIEWSYGPAMHLAAVSFVYASTAFQAMRLILLFDYGLVATTFVLWIRLLFPERQRLLPSIAILCVWLNYFPLLDAITGRELEIIELFLITLAVWALRRQREVLAGVAVGTAAMIKFLPVVFIPYLFVKGYRKAGWVATLTALPIALIAQPLLGWQWNVTLFVARHQQAWLVPTAYANQALTNVLFKMFTVFDMDNPRPQTLYPDLLNAIGSGLSLVVILATAWFFVRWRRFRFLELDCALLAIVMCLVLPHANTYYFVFVLPALSVGVAALQQRPAAFGAVPKTALAGAIVLSGFMVPMKVFEIVTHIPAKTIGRVLQGWSLPFDGAILAVALMVELHRISREQHPVLAADSR